MNDFTYTELPICPYCGHKHKDAWEWPDSTETECYGCGKTFWCERDYRVSYSTKPSTQKSE